MIRPSSVALLVACAGLSACDSGPVRNNQDAGPPDLGVTPAADAGPMADAGPRVLDAGDRTYDGGFPVLPTVNYDGPAAEVEIITDRLGIPHVYGANDADALYGSGYAMARDRLFQMDLTRRRVLGRQAELFGESRVGDDESARMINFRDFARIDAERLFAEHPEDYRLVVAWCAGVNKRIAEIWTDRTAPIPYGFGPSEFDFRPEPWTPLDAFAIGRGISFNNSDTITPEVLAELLRRSLPDFIENAQILRPTFDSFVVPAEERPAPRAATQPRIDRLPPAHLELTPAMLREAIERLDRHFPWVPQRGSNNFAIVGRLGDGTQLTENGRPLLENDPHQGLQSPNLLYALHVDSQSRGGTLDSAGFGFAGAPLVQLGHNRRVAWSATNAFPDVMDIWAVRLMQGGQFISLGGTLRPVQLRTEEITVHVDGMPVGMGDKRRYVVREVPGVGVLLPDDIVPIPVVDNGRAMLLAWVGRAVNRDVEAVLSINRATTLDAWEAGVQSATAAQFNFLAASTEGIRYRVSGAVPDRGDPTARPMPWHIVDGDDVGSLWTGRMLSAAQMPHSRGGLQGFIVTANNDQLGFSADGNLENDAYYYGALWSPGERSVTIENELRRLTARARAGTRITPADFEALATNVHSSGADLLVPVVDEVFARVATDPALAEFRGRADLAGLVAQLHAWDRRVTRESSEAVVYHYLTFLLVSRILADDLSFAFGTIADASSIYVIKWMLNTLTRRTPNADLLMLPDGRDKLVMLALSDCAEKMLARFGSLEPTAYRWGDVHFTRFGGIYGRYDTMRVPTAGGEDTPNVSSAGFFENADSGTVRDAFVSGGGAVFRSVTSFADDGTPETRFNFPRGNSGDLDSPHYGDLVENWVEGIFVPYPYRRSEVDAQMESRTVLPAR